MGYKSPAIHGSLSLSFASLVLGVGLVVSGCSPGQGQIMVKEGGLAGETEWGLTVAEDDRGFVMIFETADGPSEVWGFGVDPRLHEANVWSVGEGQDRIKVVAGRVPDGTTSVEVLTREGERIVAEVLRVGRWDVFVAEFLGSDELRLLRAVGVGSVEIERFMIPEMPPR